MKFNNGQEMLDCILSCVDLYSPSIETYVCIYNESGSIMVCSGVTKEHAEKLRKKYEYWGAYLNGYIYDSVEYQRENNCSGETNIEWCNSVFDYEDWEDVTQ